MSNKLRNIFSNKMFEMGLSLNFLDKEAHDEFLNALKIAQDEGRAVEVKGISSICTNVKDGDVMYPLMIENVVDHVMIGPSIEPVELTIDTVFGKRTLYNSR